MSAKITIYNDGNVDFQIIKLNPRSGQATEHKVLPGEGEGGECHQFRLTIDEIMLITTAETTKGGK